MDRWDKRSAVRRRVRYLSWLLETRRCVARHARLSGSDRIQRVPDRAVDLRESVGGTAPAMGAVGERVCVAIPLRPVAPRGAEWTPCAPHAFQLHVLARTRCWNRVPQCRALTSAAFSSYKNCPPGKGGQYSSRSEKESGIDLAFLQFEKVLGYESLPQVALARVLGKILVPVDDLPAFRCAAFARGLCGGHVVFERRVVEGKLLTGPEIESGDHVDIRVALGGMYRTHDDVRVARVVQVVAEIGHTILAFRLDMAIDAGHERVLGRFRYHRPFHAEYHLAFGVRATRKHAEFAVDEGALLYPQATRLRQPDTAFSSQQIAHVLLLWSEEHAARLPRRTHYTTIILK